MITQHQSHYLKFNKNVERKKKLKKKKTYSKIYSYNATPTRIYGLILKQINQTKNIQLETKDQQLKQYLKEHLNTC